MITFTLISSVKVKKKVEKNQTDPVQLSVNNHNLMKHLITLQHFSKQEILSIIKRSLEIKAVMKNIKLPYVPKQIIKLHGKTLAMIFNKRSTRTRVSAESGWAAMGGHPLFLSKEDIQIAYNIPLNTALESQLAIHQKLFLV
jgi:hypothetical protein